MHINYKMIVILVPIILLSCVVFWKLGTVRKNYSYDVNNDLDSLIDDYIKNNFNAIHSEGISVGITTSDEVIVNRQYGNVISGDEQFVLGSVSKSFTALSVMQLVDRGEIELDAPISRYLKNEKSKIADKITVRQLLNHVSGIGVNDIDLNNVEEKIECGFEYSNFNYNLLGSIVESVSNLSFAEYLSENIFQPLDMVNSTGDMSMVNIKGYQGYFGFNASKANTPAEKQKLIKAPSGYIVSTTNDMCKYLQMFLNRGVYKDKRIISEESLNEIFSFVSDASSDEVSGGMLSGCAHYGMGWIQREYKGEKIWFHSGKVKNFNSMMVLIPDRNYGFIFLNNTGNFLVGTDLFEKMTENVVKIGLKEESESMNGFTYFSKYLILDIVIIGVILLLLFNLKGMVSISEDTLPIKLIKISSLLLYCLGIGEYIRYLTSKKISLTELLDFVPDIWWFLNISTAITAVTVISAIYNLLIPKK